MSEEFPMISTDPARPGGIVLPGSMARGGPRVGLSAHGKIDLFRGLLSWLVVACHGFATAYAIHPTAGSSLTAEQHALLDHTVNAGFVWVMGFFVLSGYCIHLSVDRKLSIPVFPLRGYLVARLTRILPLYYAALAFAVIATPWISMGRAGTVSEGFDIRALLAQVFLVQNLADCYGTFTPSWSLTNEVFYYLLYGVLASVFGGRRGWPFLIGLGLCLAIGGAFQVTYLAGFKSPLVLKTGLLFGLGFNWFLGVGISVWRDRIRQSPTILAVARTWPLILIASFAGYHRGLTIQFAYVCSGIAFALLMIRLVAVPEPAGGIVEPPWMTRLVGFAGLSSYPTYLFHNSFMWVLATAIVRRGLVNDWVTLWGILVGSSLLMGGLLGWFAERPIMRWRQKLLARTDRGPSARRVVGGPGLVSARLRRESA
jgi:peptidoglycan/LPS O-acetylase OafA/YrhL